MWTRITETDGRNSPVWTKEHASSHCMHPVHLSGWMTSCFNDPPKTRSRTERPYPKRTVSPKGVYWVLWLGVVAATFVVIVLIGAPIKQALILWPLWAVFPLGLIHGGLNLVAPGAAIRWYEWVTSKDKGFSKQMGDVFSGWLGTNVDQPWRDRKARRNIRLGGLTIVGALIPYFFFLLWWSRWLGQVLK
jgi:cobalamin biosynthesis protein CobD/CbiB